MRLTLKCELENEVGYYQRHENHKSLLSEFSFTQAQTEATFNPYYIEPHFSLTLSCRARGLRTPGGRRTYLHLQTLTIASPTSLFFLPFALI